MLPLDRPGINSVDSMAWQSLRGVSPRPGPPAFGVPEDFLGGRGPPSGDFEILGAASLRSLQGCGFLINERNRFLDLFYKWERSQNGDPSKNVKDRAPGPPENSKAGASGAQVNGSDVVL